MKFIRKSNINGFDTMNIREFNDIDITPVWARQSECKLENCVYIYIDLSIMRKKSIETVLRYEYIINENPNDAKLVYENYEKICNKLISKDYCEMDDFVIENVLGSEIDV